MSLEALVIDAARASPNAPAVRAGGEVVTYGELDRAANQLARALAEEGVQRGDRIGIWSEKSPRVVAAFQAALRLGAIYVPLDPLSPVARVRTIAQDCGLRALVTTAGRAAEVAAALPELRVLCLDDGGPGTAWSDIQSLPDEALPRPESGEDDPAYILYTSGSTGTPKGVCISHRNALAFIEWAHRELRPSSDDVFGNHAPFFFDLSVLDLYVAFMARAVVTLVPEAMAFSPARLVQFIAREQVTIWYSVPSALILMMETGGLLEAKALALRIVLFAGEPFPIRHLRPLRQSLSQARFLNLYGPTETNVCTFYEVVGQIDEARTEPVPIGKASCGDRVWLEPVEGGDAEVTGEVGELVVEGPTVMLGYWGKDPQRGPYRTGDVVRKEPDGNFVYLGRRDNMLKIRGRRIEPGEIETVLLQHPALGAAAVVGVGDGADGRLVAFASVRGAEQPGLLELKRLCSSLLPRYMIVDEIRYLPELPRTPNGKIDRRRLREIAQPG